MNGFDKSIADRKDESLRKNPITITSIIRHILSDNNIIELPRHIDVEDSYFTGQYFPTKVELPCYPPSS